MAQSPENAEVALDRILLGVADAHPEQVAGWMRNEPGQWGFLAGQAILAVRQLVDRRLEDPERRWVWHRMWVVLQDRKRREQIEPTGTEPD